MATQTVKDRLSALEEEVARLKKQLDVPMAETAGQEATMRQIVTASRVREPASPPLSADSHDHVIMDAFAMVPEEYRNNLRAYFESSPGKYALGHFLDDLSRWWQANGQFQPRSVLEYHNLAGVWKDDPTWDDLMQIIKENDK